MNRAERRRRGKRGLVLYGVFDVAQDLVVAIDGFGDVDQALVWFFSQASGNALELREVGFDPRDGRDVVWLDSEITIAELWACEDPNCTAEHMSVAPSSAVRH